MTIRAWGSTSENCRISNAKPWRTDGVSVQDVDWDTQDGHYDIPLRDVIRGVMPFLILMMLAVAVLCFVPEIATSFADVVMSEQEYFGRSLP
jgi:hypothetical protein